eukprot:TRINITY_DN2419_c0_g1_i1.p1 TRINITY_DN2419_c0_g1~~TRINITY_DN2419_c0_g1_i1.p1  ORF type:complete len:133 (-),score=72.19 TRINITY_DN2419_c0_g1_i1:118-462(-)
MNRNLFVLALFLVVATCAVSALKQKQNGFSLDDMIAKKFAEFDKDHSGHLGLPELTTAHQQLVAENPMFAGLANPLFDKLSLLAKQNGYVTLADVKKLVHEAIAGDPLLSSLAQ